MSSSKTIKEKILYAMNRLPDDATFADARYKLDLIEEIEQAIKEADQGPGMDHDEFFDQLLAEYGTSKTELAGPRSKTSARDKATHRARQPKSRRKVRRLRKFVSQLRDFPFLGPKIEDQENPNLRERVFGDYRIIYRVSGEVVEILSVFHGARLLRDEDLKGD